jgi:hypothetical protein
MLRAGEPHGKAFYCCVLILALLGAALFTTEVVTWIPPALPWRVVAACIAVVFWCGVLQALERIAKPEAARRRSLNLPAGVRESLKTVRRMALLAASLGTGCCAALRLLDRSWKDMANDLGMCCVAIVFGAWCISDLMGEKLLEGYTRLQSR